MTDAVTVIRADMATIAEGVDPALARHVAELADTVENHALLLARLLDRDAGEWAVEREHPPAAGLQGDMNRGASPEDEIGSGLATGVVSWAATLWWLSFWASDWRPRCPNGGAGGPRERRRVLTP